MRPLVLSGGPAVGKSTCGRRLAAELTQAAFVDVDDIRQLVVAGDRTLWSGPEGERQHVLAARNAATVGRNFVEAGIAVTIADIVTADTLGEYRAALPDCLVVHLRIMLEEARQRAATRKVYITDEEFQLLHMLVASPPEVDLVIDVRGMTVGEQTSSIRSAWRRLSGAVH